MRYVYYCENDTVNGPVGRLEYTKPVPRKFGRSADERTADRVWRMSAGLYMDGRSPYGWDAPTFKIQSDRLW